MKILITTHTQYQKNAYAKHFERAKYLAKLGNEVTFLITSNSRKIGFEEKIIDNVKVLMAPDLLWGVLRQGLCPWNIINRIIKLLVIGPFNSIHTIDSRPATILPALVSKLIFKSKLFMEWTDLFGRGGAMTQRSSKLYQLTFGKIESFFEEYFRKYADGTFTISTYLTDLQNKHLNISKDKNKQLPLGSDMARIIDYDKKLLRLKMNLDINKIFLIYVGNIYPDDEEVLISVCNEILKKYDEVNIILIGMKFLNYSGKQQYICPGFVDDETLFDYLGAADINLLPLKDNITNNARFPSKMNDYFVTARPLVASPTGEIKILYNNYKFGILSDSDNQTDFRNAVLEMINSSDRWSEYGAEAVRCAREKFDNNILANQIIDHYKKCGVVE
ncbi:MAG: hypothetical protein COW08_05360 [Ignavibacteriales bacterium CG12_big_fil_rev_8_21_14_0_65_30_8]|nr:MAG: hypothetical protein COW08_05360 [Ignavibacteriales bacterium CG12_big_fil_rev_8_21_14_0_65_30_8]